MARKNTESDGRLLTVSQMADRVGISGHTLRFYEAEGLIAPQRTTGGQRRYAPEDADWLRELVELREAGMSLPELSDYAGLRDEATAPEQRLELLLAHEAQLRTRLLILRRHLRATERQIERHRTE